MVYVLNQDGQPIMPTSNHAKVRVLLKEGKAKVVKRCPFTIQLLYSCGNHTQPISLGVDTGSKHIGISATTKKKMLYESDIQLRNDITSLLSSRKEIRKTRRLRKTRHRKARFMNRGTSKIPTRPSIKQKIDTHITAVKFVHMILPVTNIIVETASFDIQKIKNPNIQGEDYLRGEQYGFSNVREYVLWRDNHTCQCCKGKSKDKILNVHHIESRKIGGNAPNNLVVLCKTCHSQYHFGKIKLPKSIKRGDIFRDEAFMGLMRWDFYGQLKEMYSNVKMTYGYITKSVRIANNLPKEHYIDARCISGNPQAVSDGIVYYQRKIRCHNRQLHQMCFSKKGKRLCKSMPYLVHGFRLYDIVMFKGEEYYISARRKTGFFRLRKLTTDVVEDSVSWKKIRFIDTSCGFLTERRYAI